MKNAETQLITRDYCEQLHSNKIETWKKWTDS